MFEKLLPQVLPGLTEDAGDRLLQQLEGVGKQILVGELSKQTARALLKSIDTVAAIAVANLVKGDAERLVGAYAQTVLVQIQQLAEATAAYVPLQIGVEVAKQRFGTTSGEATAARKRREAGINELRAEVRDVLRAATGGTVSD